MIAALLIGALLSGAPCIEPTIMKTGQPAACDGEVRPEDDWVWALKRDALAETCEIGRRGDASVCAIAARATEFEIDRLERLLDDRGGFDWTAFVTGASVGAAVVAVVVLGIVEGTR